MQQLIRRARQTFLILGVSLLVVCLPLHAEVTNPQTVELLFDKGYAPASYVNEQGALLGFHQQIIQLVDDQLAGYDIVFKPMDWRSALKQVESGEALGVVGPFFLGDLRPYMHPYSRSLYDEKVIVICNSKIEFAEPINWPTSFTNKLMLNIQGYDGWLNNQVRQRRFTALMNFLEVPNIYIAAQMVSRGNADCSLFEELALAYMEQEADIETPLNVTKVAAITAQPVHVGYSFAALQKPENAFMQDFIRQFDFTVYKLQQEGKIEQLLERFKQRLDVD